MKIKNVEMVATPSTPHYVGDGFRVHNFIPSHPRLDMYHADPFIMLDYNSKFYFPPSENPKGVGVHPHRGFETVTIVYKGKVEHADSSGAGGVIQEGDVQWMTAARGVLHKEYHETEWSKTGGEFHVVQLWVNLPAKYKMSPPKYQAIENKTMQKVILDNNAGMVEVIAGTYKGVEGSASTFSPIHLMNVKLNAGGKANFDFPKDYTTALLVIEGDISVNQNEQVPTDHLVLFAKDGESFQIEANENAIVLLMSGEPLREPIAAHGPFVMNTREEIAQAFSDYQSGKFGVLEE
ncbi:MAG: pirin family protein [Chitinophagaceae bacterium]|mgnify:CR=1 FL=1|nr:MAG: pirin [Bacteroidetes bacterium OLB11]MCC6448796.1 pirin family protein [Chitinophagaceae bacterium]HMN31927.1 pirin family protein [Chitinophagaceae bacterium]